MTTQAYTGLVVLVAIGRLVEMTVSRAHRRALARAGGELVPERGFGAIVALHVGVLAGAIAEVWLAERVFVAALAIPMLVVLAAANALRWWVIATLGRHWNVGIVDSAASGIVHHGPYRWIRHPNYVAVFIEMLALPLVHTAFVTAIVGTVLHVPILWRRVAAEEAVLVRHAPYRALMAHKPRFWPRRSP